MLQVANTRYGRQLLGIDERLPEIVALRRSSLTARLSERQYVSQFRTAPKYARVIAHRWAYFQEYARYLKAARQNPYALESLSAIRLGRTRLMTATVSTFSPDPDPETDTVDGYVEHNEADSAFTTLVNGAGTTFNDSNTDMQSNIYSGFGQASDTYRFIRRPVMLFDTSSLPDGDSIDAAELQLFVDAKVNGLSGEDSDNSRRVAVSSAPASDTALAAGDYDSLGGTSFGESDKQADLTTSAYNIITLNSSGRSNIDATGISKFGIRTKWDFNDTTTGLTWADDAVQRVSIEPADQTGTNEDPILEVTHTAAVPKGGHSLMGVGI